jgi:hypothetical protein
VYLSSSLPSCARRKWRSINTDQTRNDVISTIARLDVDDVDELLLNDCALAGDDCFGSHYDSPDQLFVFSKSLSASRSADRRSILTMTNMRRWVVTIRIRLASTVICSFAVAVDTSTSDRRIHRTEICGSTRISSATRLCSF